MTDDELADVLEQAEILPRQLAALRATYPGWNINFEYLPNGARLWRAELIRLFTIELKLAGVVAIIECLDPYSLSSALAHQVALIHNNRFSGCLGP